MFNMLNPLVTSTTVVSYDIASQVTDALKNLQSQLVTIANPVASIAIVICGLYLLFGSDPSTIKKVKSWALAIFFGMVLINGVGPIVEWLGSIGG